MGSRTAEATKRRQSSGIGSRQAVHERHVIPATTGGTGHCGCRGISLFDASIASDVAGNDEMLR